MILSQQLKFPPFLVQDVGPRCIRHFVLPFVPSLLCRLFEINVNPRLLKGSTEVPFIPFIRQFENVTGIKLIEKIFTQPYTRYSYSICLEERKVKTIDCLQGQATFNNIKMPYRIFPIHFQLGPVLRFLLNRCAKRDSKISGLAKKSYSNNSTGSIAHFS